jgi:hypothetical protein
MVDPLPMTTGVRVPVHVPLVARYKTLVRVSAQALTVDVGFVAAVATPPATATPATNAAITFAFLIAEMMPALAENFLL